MTLRPLGCGLSSILSAIDGKFWHAYWFLFASAMLDGLDGHAARALKVAPSPTAALPPEHHQYFLLGEGTVSIHIFSPLLVLEAIFKVFLVTKALWEHQFLPDLISL